MKEQIEISFIMITLSMSVLQWPFEPSSAPWNSPQKSHDRWVQCRTTLRASTVTRATLKCLVTLAPLFTEVTKARSKPCNRGSCFPVIDNSFESSILHLPYRFAQRPPPTHHPESVTCTVRLNRFAFPISHPLEENIPSNVSIPG